VAQKAFDLKFELPDQVPSPPLRIVELDKKIILDWESDTAQVNRVEGFNSRGYTFDGYNMYQLPSAGATIAQAKLVQPFDITLPRSFVITTDKFRSRPLVDGQKYYFAVTASAKNPNVKDEFGNPDIIGSPLLIKVAIPHSPNPGTVYPYPLPASNTGGSNVVLDVTNKSGVDDARITFTYFDPSRPDGHSYEIPFFKVDQDFRWNFIDRGTSHRPLQDTLLRSFPIDTSARFSDRGFTLDVNRVLIGIKGVYETKSNNQPANNFVFSTPNPKSNYFVIGRVNSFGISDLDSIKGGNTSDRDVEWRFGGDSSWALMRGASTRFSRWVRVPYTAWQMAKDTSQQDRQSIRSSRNRRRIVSGGPRSCLTGCTSASHCRRFIRSGSLRAVPPWEPVPAIMMIFLIMLIPRIMKIRPR